MAGEIAAVERGFAIGDMSAFVVYMLAFAECMEEFVEQSMGTAGSRD